MCDLPKEIIMLCYKNTNTAVYIIQPQVLNSIYFGNNAYDSYTLIAKIKFI